MLKFWKDKCYRKVIGNPITAMFFFNLTFIYVYLVGLIQRALLVITIMAEWHFAHLSTRMYGYMLLVFKKYWVDISRKI